MPSSRQSSQPRDQTCVSYISCIGRQVLYHWCHVGSPELAQSRIQLSDLCILLLGSEVENIQYLVTISRRRHWHPTPVLLPGKSHGWRSLVGCSPWGHEESDTTERLHFHFPLSGIGEGNGNPLVFLPGESQGRGSLVGCCLWGRTESDTTEAT